MYRTLTLLVFGFITTSLANRTLSGDAPPLPPPPPEFIDGNLGTFMRSGTINSCQSRTFDGTSVSIDDYSFMVSLDVDGEHHCGGTLIAPTLVLTAARCVDGTAFKHKHEVTVRIGTSFIDSGGLAIPIEEVILHPEFSRELALNDIAILRLKSEATERSEFPTETIQLWTGDATSVEGVKAAIYGWGYTVLRTPSPDFKQTFLSIKSSSECIEKYGVETMHGKICADCGVGNGTCFGDSGGPLVLDGMQIGVISNAIHCGIPELPPLFNSVPFYIEWIKQNIGFEN